MAVQSFNSEIQLLDFKKAEQSADIINNWVANKTNNMIRNIVDPSIFDKLTKIFMVNAIHFKAEWLQKFDRRLTKKDQFYLADGTTIEVDFMRNYNGLFNYGSNTALNAIVLELPYKEPGFSMVLVLPNDKKGILTLENKLSSVDLNSITQGFVRQPVGVIVPRFKFDFHVDLKKSLKLVTLMDSFNIIVFSRVFFHV